MQELYNTIKSDMREAFKSGYKQRTSILKVLTSDIQRDPNKDYSDEKVISVIRKTIKMAEESKADDSDAVKELLSNYLPNVSNDTIMDIIKDIDFAKLKNPKQAIGIVMSKLPKGAADGKKVSKMVDKYLEKGN